MARGSWHLLACSAQPDEAEEPQLPVIVMHGKPLRTIGRTQYVMALPTGGKEASTAGRPASASKGVFFVKGKWYNARGEPAEPPDVSADPSGDGTGASASAAEAQQKPGVSSSSDAIHNDPARIAALQAAARELGITDLPLPIALAQSKSAVSSEYSTARIVSMRHAQDEELRRFSYNGRPDVDSYHDVEMDCLLESRIDGELAEQLHGKRSVGAASVGSTARRGDAQQSTSSPATGRNYTSSNTANKALGGGNRTTSSTPVQKPAGGNKSPVRSKAVTPHATSSASAKKATPSSKLASAEKLKANWDELT